MDRKSYENVLSDLELGIKSKRAQAEKLNEEILQDENVASVLRMKLKSKGISPVPQIINVEAKQQVNSDFALLANNEYTKENQSKISLNNACEKILQNEGKRLYITDLIEKLKDYGRFTDRVQLSGTIRKDNKNRFVNLGQNVWDLASRQPKAAE